MLLHPFIISVITIYLSGSLIPAFAQAPDTLWTRVFGGSDYDYSYSVKQIASGGFILTGCTMSYGAGDYDVTLTRVTSSGNRSWTRLYGGSEGDCGVSVQQTSDNGFIICGHTSSYGAGKDDIWLIRTNPLGDTLWTKTYGGNEDDQGESVEKTSDGGFIITGYTYSYGSGDPDVILIRTDSLGNELWTRNFGGNGGDLGASVRQTSDGGFIIAGQTNSFGSGFYDIWLIKTDQGGDTVWTRTFGGSNPDYGYCVRQTSDGGYAVIGRTNSFGAGDADIFLVRTDSSGNQLWSETYGWMHYESGHYFEQTSDGGFIIAGKTNSYGPGNSDVLIIKTDSGGDTLWTKILGGSGYDEGYCVQQTLDGGYIVTGTTDSFGSGLLDFWLIRLDAENPTSIEDQNFSNPELFHLFQNYPNPFNPVTKIRWQSPVDDRQTLKIYDVLGNEIVTLVDEFRPAGRYEVEFSAKGGSASGGNVINLSSGVYFYRLSLGEFTATRKMLLVK